MWVFTLFVALFTNTLCFGKINDDIIWKNEQNYFHNGAVAADAEICSEIGRDILKDGGHAVDATIGALFCSGVVNLHSSGVAGGTLFNIRHKGAPRFYDARDTGPQTLTPDTYDRHPNLKMAGGLSVGVPGAIRGMRTIYKRYARLKWSRLMTPAIELAENGFPVSAHMAGAIQEVKDYILKDVGMREILINPDGKLKKAGDLIIDKKLAQTLRTIRDEPDALNDGSLSQQFVDDVNKNGGSMTLQDLKSYSVKERPLINFRLDSENGVHTTSLPSAGGVMLTSILQILRGYYWNKHDLGTDEKSLLTYHRMIEAFKFSYALQPHLGDPDKVEKNDLKSFKKKISEILNSANCEAKRLRINDTKTQTRGFYDNYFKTKEDGGTTHVSVIDKDGNAVAATSTINNLFGARFRSQSLGIIYNDVMADFFAKDNFGKNYVKPMFNAPGAGKRPISSMTPTIVTNATGHVTMVVGASGGLRIPLSVATVIMRKLWFGQSLDESIEAFRLQEVFGDYIISEENKKYAIPTRLKRALRKKGHVIKSGSKNGNVQAIFVDDAGRIYAKSDPRKNGKAAGY